MNVESHDESVSNRVLIKVLDNCRLFSAFVSGDYGGRETINKTLINTMIKTSGISPSQTRQEIAIQAQVAQGWITNINSKSGVRAGAQNALNLEGVV